MLLGLESFSYVLDTTRLRMIATYSTTIPSFFYVFYV